MYLRTCGVLSPQITNKKNKLGPKIANPQSTTFDPQICGFAVCGAYLLTGRLNKNEKKNMYFPSIFTYIF
jgi:hypothetical protein